MIISGKKLTHIRYCVVHRISLAQYHAKQNPNPISDKDLDAHGLIHSFQNTALGTGGWAPYHFLVKPNGKWEQVIALGYRGAHSRGYNHCSIAVAVVGNTEDREMSTKQYNGLVKLLRLLREGWIIDIVGHDELPGACGDPNKRCPGRFLPMDALRRELGEFKYTGDRTAFVV
jgi:N-acetyl-anhydromuramyl-L-alanine amidase AmpD